MLRKWYTAIIRLRTKGFGQPCLSYGRRNRNLATSGPRVRLLYKTICDGGCDRMVFDRGSDEIKGGKREKVERRE